MSTDKQVPKKELHVKDKRTFTFVLKEGGAYVNGTGKTPYLSAKQDLDSTVEIFDVAGSFNIASEGTCQITLNSTETGLEYHNLHCHVTTVDGDGNRVNYGGFMLDILPSAKE